MRGPQPGEGVRWLAIIGLVAAIAFGLWSSRPAPRAGVSPQVSAAYATLGALGPGDVMLLVADFDPAAIPELSPFVHLAVAVALMRGAHVATLSLSPQGAMLADRHLREALTATHGVYGRDGVNLGFIEGRPTVAHLLGMPLQRLGTRDHAGDAIADMPIAAELARLSDVALVTLVANGAPGAKDWMLQAQGRFAKTLLVATTGNEGPELTPFFQSGQVAGLLSGARDVAAFADLYGHDWGVNADPIGTSYVHTLQAQMRAQRWAHVLLVVFLIGGQAWSSVRRRRKG